MKLTSCILWAGSVWSQGRYGMARINGISTTVHRVAWIKKFGPVPDGLVVCHRCDTGLCVNTEHLFLGTRKENMQDCITKGRFKRPQGHDDQKGQNNFNANPGLEERNKSILIARKNGKTYAKIKEEFGIKSNGHLRNILKQQTNTVGTNSNNRETL